MMNCITTAVKGGVGGSDIPIHDDEIRNLRDGSNKPIRPRDMGLNRLRNDKISYLVKLSGVLRVGIGMTGGQLIYNRVRVSPVDPRGNGIGGEWVIRQYLRDAEADLFMRVLNEPTDSVVACIRGLPKVIELDNGVMREVKKHYENEMGPEMCVHVITYPHIDRPYSSPYLDDFADEPVLVVSFLNVPTGGEALRRAWTKKNGTKGELRIGTLNLQTFVDPEAIFGKAPPVTGSILDIDASQVIGNDDMGKVIRALGASFAEKVQLIVRRSNGRWLALLKRD
jgi:hypothetical protein